MSKSWYKTESDSEAENHAIDFWSRHREQLQAGEFWADRIKKLRGEPAKRLELALENLPLPASFREAAIATRALIREKIKLKENYDEELALLYWLAVINSFSIPYSEVLQEPGYNVVESIPGKKLQGLPFSYNELGYQKLKLLNKTDIKWFINNWGEPSVHSTLHDIHIDVWREYENKLKTRRSKEEQIFLQKLNNNSITIPHVDKPKLEAPKNNSPSKWIIVAAAIVLIIIFILGKG